MNVDRALLPLLGEYAWHSITVDPRIADMSRAHYNLVRPLLESLFPGGPAGREVLEVACYAHTTGYDLVRDLGCNVTLFELSAATLRLGRALAGTGAGGAEPTLVIGDFHDLPFESCAFDFVYMCSALHHTWNYQQVSRELMRVIRPGGILFMENEPCRRGACFYKFRCNRPSDFTALERHLDEAGLLRTIAEPYIGSRPETQFGMIENQRIPLTELLDVFAESGAFERLEVFPEICMGPRERAWLDARTTRPRKLASMIERELRDGCDAARHLLGPVELGLGFDLPDRHEIARVASQTALQLAALSGDPCDNEFRCALAEIFGAAVRLTVRRSGDPSTPAVGGTIRSATLDADGIVNTFGPVTRRLLGRDRELPDLSKASVDAIAEVFRPDDWTIATSANGIVCASPIRTRARIVVAERTESSTLVLRLHCGIGEAGFYEARLLVNGQRLDAVRVFHQEGRLCVARLPPRTTEVVMEFAQIDSDSLLGSVPPVTVIYADRF